MGFENDKLNRKKYAEFLTEIISNPEKYKRISDSESMSMAIDSGWGTGKTTFIDMWSEELENIKNEDEKNKFAVIKYDAWKNDFSEEPLQSLIYTIVNHSIFNEQNEIDGGIQAGKDLFKYASKIIIGATKLVTRFSAGSEIGDAAGDMVETLLNEGTGGIKKILEDKKKKDPKYENFYLEYKNYYETINKLKESLEKVTQKRKIIIIIDELDRCKPLFAIKLLENIKHILDVKNVSFIFSLDMEQLSHSIKCIYGQEMDASGYLSRFFDYISKMPKPDKEIYIKFLIEEKKMIRTSFAKNEDANSIKIINFSDIFYDFASKMNLSLRDINTIYSNFLILEANQLKSTICYQAYSLYLFLLILKYKRIDLFNKLFLENNRSVLEDRILQRGFFNIDNNFLRECIGIILSNNIIEENNFNITNTVENRIGKITKIEENKLWCRNQYLYKIVLNTYISVSNCLFYDDLQKWNEIKSKTMLTYIQENLEFFDFEK